MKVLNFRKFSINCKMKRIWGIHVYFITYLFGFFCREAFTSDTDESNNDQRFRIDGKVMVSQSAEQDWMVKTRVLVDGGDYLGFLRGDGSFTLNSIPSGSYTIEIVSPTYAFDPVRVDVNAKGKIRARRLNNIQPSKVETVTYPLKFKAKGKHAYFQAREQWRITDFLYSPMVLMMVLPFIMIMVLPKLVNTQDPETQKEMQQQMNFLNNPKQSMPDMSELMTSWFSGGQPKKSVPRTKAVKKRQ